MKGERIIRKGLKYCGVLLLWGLCAQGILGCAPSPKVQGVLGKMLRPNTTEIGTWHEGLSAFQRGEYEKAVALFEILNELAEDTEMSRRGLFGLASTRLVLARTAEEFNEAMALLECWVKEVPYTMEGEDPRMLIPALERSLLFDSAATGRPKGAKMDRNSLYSNFMACKNTLQAKDKELDRLKSRLDAKEREIRKLKGQIESLEAIHRKFQERKQEVSSP